MWMKNGFITVDGFTILYRQGEITMTEAHKELIKKAEEWIDAHKEEFITEIQNMSRIPSVSRADLAEPGAPFGPECRRMLDYALECGRSYGFETKDHDGYAGSIYMGDPDNSLGIIAHLDVVPVGEGWIYPQFGATYLPEHDALVGRGVDDNKGPAVAGLFAMRMLREFGWPLKHGLRLICGCSEETGMDDMKVLVERGEIFPKTSLVPDAGFPVNYGQKGNIDAMISTPCEGNLLHFDAGSVFNIVPDKAECVLDLDEETVKKGIASLDSELQAALTVTACPEGTAVTAIGRAGHAANPANALNAVYLLARALTESKLLNGSCAGAIRELCELTSDSFCESEGAAFEDDISGKTTLVYSIAHLTDGKLTVGLDCRFSITYKAELLLEKLEADWNRRGYVIDSKSVANPFYIPKDDPRVIALQELFHEVTGSEREPYTMGGGTYSRVVPNAISYGAGIPEASRVHDFMPEGHGGAHGKDETLVMEKAYTCAKIYTVALAMLDELVD